MRPLSTSPVWAMVNGFAALGGASAILVTRQPEFFKRWALTSADWGWVLFAAGLGGVLAYPLNRWLLANWGSRAMLHRLGAAGGVLLALIPWLPGLPGLLAGVLLQGVIYSGIGVALNHQAAQWELRSSRRVMGRLHASFYLGSGLSALASSVLGALGVGLPLHMAAMALFAACLHRAAARSLSELAPLAPPPAQTPGRGIGGSFALGLLFSWCMVLEGGVTGWASVYLDRALKASESVASLGVAVFAAAMALGRLFSDRLVTRYGALPLMRAGAAACAVALISAATMPLQPVALLAFAATGFGLAAAAPLVFSTAGRMSGEILAFVAGMGAVGGLLGPLLLGRVAAHLSLAWVLAALAMVSLVIAWQAKVLAERHVPAEAFSAGALGSTRESA